MPTPPAELLRRAIVRAVEVARAGEAGRPPVAAPAALRPVLRFTRLPAQARAAVISVLDADAEFRERVADAVDRDDVGRAAWLWLARPAGWERELTQLLEELDEPVLPERERDADKALRRRVEGAERAAARAEERAARAHAELDRARHDLDAARAQHAALVARFDELDERLAAAVTERRAAVAELKRVEGLLARRSAERRGLEERIAELEVAGASEAEAAPPGPDARELRTLVDRLARRAAALDEDLSALRAALGPEPARPAPAPARRRATRRPERIPGGLTEESEQAATHLLQRPGAVLLVDGYNVSMSAWPEVDIAEQRMRMERLLADLAARTPGLTVDLVFDGAEVLPLARVGARRARGVTVRFTAADVEADDALLELADGYPHDRPVIVVSDDRRVRDGARRRGANVLTAAQLLAVARP
jgi:predicted RNA-binding protein with PIN domain